LAIPSGSCEGAIYLEEPLAKFKKLPVGKGNGKVMGVSSQ
jgi:hypothetical protein